MKLTWLRSPSGNSAHPGRIGVFMDGAKVFSFVDTTPNERLANLLSAAPDLLEACKAVMAYVDTPLKTEWNGESASAMIRRVEAAIAKAEGRTK